MNEPVRSCTGSAPPFWMCGWVSTKSCPSTLRSIWNVHNLALSVATVVALTETLIAQGRDFLFRHPNTNKPWDDPTGNGMAMWFRRLKKKAGIERPELTAYGYPHRFATNLILKDVPLKKVAELLGHSSIKTLERWYCHLKGNDKALTDVLDAVSA